MPAVPMRPVEGPEVWSGAALTNSEAWVYRLSPADVAELATAARRTMQSRLSITAISKDDFVLPLLAPVLAKMLDELIHGRGFILVKGIPVAACSREEIARMYWGIGRHIGDPVAQNHKGHLLGHIKDLELPDTPGRRPYQTRIGLHYHADACDVVGLMCLHPAKTGGLSTIASSGAVYNALLARSPDLVRELCGTFYADRKEEVPADKLPYYAVSIFNFFAGYLTTVQLRTAIEAAQRFPQVPRLTERQRKALDAIQAAAELSLKMDFDPGDIQFLHNHTVLHARTPFEDHPETDRKRHLLRLWLSVGSGRPLPPIYADRWGNIAVGSVRGGITVPGIRLNAPLEAV